MITSKSDFDFIRGEFKKNPKLFFRKHNDNGVIYDTFFDVAIEYGYHDEMLTLFEDGILIDFDISIFYRWNYQESEQKERRDNLLYRYAFSKKATPELAGLIFTISDVDYASIYILSTNVDIIHALHIAIEKSEYALNPDIIKAVLECCEGDFIQVFHHIVVNGLYTVEMFDMFCTLPGVSKSQLIKDRDVH